MRTLVQGIGFPAMTVWNFFLEHGFPDGKCTLIRFTTHKPSARIRPKNFSGEL